MLRDLGIPVESDPGRYGTYYLRPGFRLPPLLFTNTEMLAIILGLIAARHLGLSGALGVESATAKIERVLPEELRERVPGSASLRISTIRSGSSIRATKAIPPSASSTLTDWCTTRVFGMPSRIAICEKGYAAFGSTV
jgi:predicted DNA-binding transcriptional regulator YafY